MMMIIKPLPIEMPIDIPIYIKIDIPSDIPIDVPIDVPLDVLIDVPIDEPIDIPIDIPNDIPIDIPIDIPLKYQLIYQLIYPDIGIYRVIFLTGPPLKLSLDWPPPQWLHKVPYHLYNPFSNYRSCNITKNYLERLHSLLRCGPPQLKQRIFPKPGELGCLKKR